MDADGVVLVAGASGKTGRAALRFLAGTGWRVRGLTRSEDRTARLRDRGADEVVVGDLLEPADAARAVEGADAVLTCVGSTPVQVWTADEFVDGAGNRNLIAAAADAGVERFVMQSSLGVGDDRGSWLARVFRVAVGPVVRAKTDAERALRASGLTYTVLRPGVLLTVPARGSVQVADAPAGLWGPVPRADVARLMVAALSTPAVEDRTLEVVCNPLARERAVDVDWRDPAG